MNKLIEIAEVTSGQGAPQSQEYFSKVGIPFVRAGKLEMLITSGEENSCELITKENAEKLGLRLFQKDTILFAKSGMSATLGRVYRLKCPCYLTNHLAAIIPNNCTDPSYLQRWFEYFPPSRLIPNESYPSIRLSDIQNLDINIPKEISEQERISDLLNKADSICKKRQKSLRLAEEFLRSTFFNMFGDPVTNPKKFEECTIDEYSELVSSGSTPLGGERVYSKVGIPFYRSQNVLMNEFDLSDIAYIKKEIHDSMKRTWLKNGDILLNITGASIGRVNVYRGEDDKANVNQHVCIIRLDSHKMIPEFLAYFISHENYQKKIIKQNAGATRQAFNFEQIKTFKVFSPTIELQKRFLEIYNRLSIMKGSYRLSLTESENLFNSLMQRAFKGEL
jgi:type I restriction enzyme S subunit